MMEAETTTAETTTESSTVATEVTAVADDTVNTDNTNGTETAPAKPNLLDHSFQPGDHVIRWEMLPIAWPIQIHGIVLNVSDAGVVLVDFGLTAQHGHNPEASKSEQPSEESTTDSNTEGESTTTESKAPSLFSSDPKEMAQAQSVLNTKIQKSFARMHPTREKQRLNVLILDDLAEIKKWKKVNYDGGLFGFGGSGADNENEEETKKKWWKKMSFKSSKTESSKDEEEAEASPSNNNAQSRPSWFRRSSASSVTKDEITSTEATTEVDTKEKPWWKKLTPVSAETKTNAPAQDEQEEKTESSMTEATIIEEKPELSAIMPTEPDEGGGVEESKEEPPEIDTDTAEGEGASDIDPSASSSPLASRAMNPAMAKLLEGKSNDECDSPTKTSTFKNKMSSFFKKNKQQVGDEAEATAPPKKLDLPKADPPKLVLARTRWLLQHGESVLPPYHAFHSNSECIAVFCKTGYWSTLQSDVFLHSTAIGNAKTMGAATLGVAASVPILAPVIAGLGIGMVAAPWLLLHNSKQTADEYTQRMSDEFWEQAEPEVFVECIEHWSKLEEYYAAKEKKASGTDAGGNSDDGDAPKLEEEDSPKIISL